MKIAKVIVLFLIINVIFCTNESCAKYVYNYEEIIIELTKDNTPPKCEVSYSTEEWTNQNVIVTITSNKEIEQVSGFILSEDRKMLTKEITENTEEIIKVRDFSGNCTEVEYEVNNIDKEFPQIIGCENEGHYKGPLDLEYSDNLGIQEILVDKYSNELEITSNSTFYDNYAYYGVDRNDTTITVHIKGHPLNTKKYRYFLNNQLYATSDKESYTFTGLNKGMVYDIKVEAIGKDGNVLDEQHIKNSTSYYSTIISNKTTDKFVVNIKGLSEDVTSVSYTVNCLNDTDNIIKIDNAIINSDKTCEISVKELDPYKLSQYEMNVIMYGENMTEICQQEFIFDLHTNYENNSDIIDKYKLTQSGNYQIIVKDLADNEVFYYIKVE